MTVRHPVQLLASTPELLITASDCRISTFDAITNAPISHANQHKGLVRFMCIYSDAATATNYLISTGEDKQLIVSKLPHLELVSTRGVPKRANALEVTDAGEIVVGDKFGDVYVFPLEAPADAPPLTGDDEKDAHQPILGHVSMLTSMALLQADPANGWKHDWIATGDRDEHVRISRFSAGHIIEKYAWGSKSLVSALLYLPAPPTTATSTSATPVSGPLLLSAGGDTTIQIFSLPTAELIGQFPIAELMLPHITVSAQRPVPIPAGRRKDKRGERKAGSKDADAAAVSEAGPDDEVEMEAEAEATPSAGRQMSDLPKGLVVTKLVEVGTTRENGGVVVLVSGSTALLFIPYTCLLAPSGVPSPVTPSLLPFRHPILDVVGLPVPAAAGSLSELLVSLDVTRASSTAEMDASPPVARVSVRSDDLSLAALPTLTTDAVLFETACATTKTQPAVSSLYPLLSLLHHPGDAMEDGEASGETVDRRNRGKKRTGPIDSDAATDSSDARRPGKRAAGRAETLQRYEDAKRKLATESAALLTEGEKAAVQEVESEAQADAATTGATTEGAVVA